MRDVLDELLRWWQAGEPVGLATVTATWSSAPRQPGAAMAGRPGRHGRRQRLRRLRRRRGLRAVPRGAPSPARRRPSGTASPTTTRSRSACPAAAPSSCSSNASTGSRSRSCRCSPPRSATGRPVALLTGVEGPAGRHVVLTPDDRAGTLGGDRLDDAVTDDGRGLLAAGRTGLLHYGPDGRAPRLRPHRAGQRVRAARPDDRVRRDRPRRRGGPDRCVPGLPGDGLRRPAGVRDRAAVPRRRTRWWSTGRTATSRPSPRRAGWTAGPSSACSPTTRSSTCRCSRSRCGCRSGTSARWAPAVPTTTGSNGSARPTSPRRWPTAGLADRPGPGRPYAGGDGGQRGRRDRRAALGRHRDAGSPPPRERFTRDLRATRSRAAGVRYARQRLRFTRRSRVSKVRSWPHRSSPGHLADAARAGAAARRRAGPAGAVDQTRRPDRAGRRRQQGPQAAVHLRRGDRGRRHHADHHRRAAEQPRPAHRRRRRRLGLRCVLVLGRPGADDRPRQPDPRRAGRRRDRLGRGAAGGRGGRRRGESGGRDRTSSRSAAPRRRSIQGYVDCARELTEQLPDFDRVVVAVGSGGTMAGLVAELGPDRVLGFDSGAVAGSVHGGGRAARRGPGSACGSTADRSAPGTPRSPSRSARR